MDQARRAALGVTAERGIGIIAMPADRGWTV
jgi:hypothetical protein